MVASPSLEELGRRLDRADFVRDRRRDPLVQADAVFFREPCSRRLDRGRKLQRIGRLAHRKISISSSAGRAMRTPKRGAASRKSFHVVRHQGIGPTVDRSLEDEFVAGISKLRAPLHMDLHRLDQGSQGIQGLIHLGQTQPRDLALIGALQHILILKEQRRRRKRLQAPKANGLQQHEPCSLRTPESGGHHGRI